MDSKHKNKPNPAKVNAASRAALVDAEAAADADNVPQPLQRQHLVVPMASLISVRFPVKNPAAGVAAL